jgi:phosphotransferase system enzyme I (PtsI)
VIQTASGKTVIKRMGIPISEGIGSGKGWIIAAAHKRFRVSTKIAPEQRHEEEGKVRHAIQLVSFVIDNAIAQVKEHAGHDMAQIFVVLKSLLHDPLIFAAITDCIRNNNLTAYGAVKKSFRQIKKTFEQSAIPYMQQRVSDIIEIEQDLLDALVNPVSLLDRNSHPASADRKHGYVVLSKFLTPRLVLEIRGKNVQGIVTEVGGRDSHAAILCRTFALPAVAGIRNIDTPSHEGTTIALNGENGEVVIGKSHLNALLFLDTAEEYNEKCRKIRVNRRFPILANINLAEHAFPAVAAGADGIGLYRTELEFLAADRMLSSRDQYKKYRMLVMSMMGLPVTFRLLDMRPDKLGQLAQRYAGKMDFSRYGAQFLISHPALLKNQAKAIGGVASFGPIKILYPMIETPQQFSTIKEMLLEQLEPCDTGEILHGVMFELPEACDRAGELFSLADFGSIGTNDLSQFLFSADRENDTSDSSSDKKRLWEKIDRVITAAKESNKPVTVCGEMAAAAEHIERFIARGIDGISVDVTKIKKIRAMIDSSEGT